ncbi:glycosyltransferase family 8 protein [Gallibacterium salpingitidis]|uniref:glycosyltransferase family 8 protein n=1 Tax=Gallibacterium salpingitidis TaxID=505341 RepID=UPI00345F28E5
MPKKIIKEALSSEITFIQVNIEEFSGFSLTIPSITITTYFRLNIAQYLSSVEKVIYIDVDTIITNDITALWNTPLHNKSIAAVYDHLLELVQGGGGNNTYKNKIGVKDPHIYFNAGVLLINLKKFSQKSSPIRIKNYLSNFGTALEFQDQDILNFLFENDVYYLNPRFNFMYSLTDTLKKIDVKKFNIDSSIAILKMPKFIVHFAGGTKAWHLESLKKETFLYDYLYRHSPWKHIPLKSRKKRSAIGLLWYKIRRYLPSYIYHLYYHFNFDKAKEK